MEIELRFIGLSVFRIVNDAPADTEDIVLPEMSVAGIRFCGIKMIDAGNSAGAWNDPWTAVLIDEEIPEFHRVEIRMEAADLDKLFTVFAFGYTE